MTKIRTSSHNNALKLNFQSTTHLSPPPPHVSMGCIKMQSYPNSSDLDSALNMHWQTVVEIKRSSSLDKKAR